MKLIFTSVFIVLFGISGHSELTKQAKLVRACAELDVDLAISLIEEGEDPFAIFDSLSKYSCFVWTAINHGSPKIENSESIENSKSREKAKIIFQKSMELLPKNIKNIQSKSLKQLYIAFKVSIESNNTEIINELLDYGINIHNVIHDGITYINLALNNNKNDIVDIIIDRNEQKCNLGNGLNKWLINSIDTDFKTSRWGMPFVATQNYFGHPNPPSGFGSVIFLGFLAFDICLLPGQAICSATYLPYKVHHYRKAMLTLKAIAYSLLDNEDDGIYLPLSWLKHIDEQERYAYYTKKNLKNDFSKYLLSIKNSNKNAYNYLNGNDLIYAVKEFVKENAEKSLNLNDFERDINKYIK